MHFAPSHAKPNTIRQSPIPSTSSARHETLASRQLTALTLQLPSRSQIPAVHPSELEQLWHACPQAFAAHGFGGEHSAGIFTHPRARHAAIEQTVCPPSQLTHRRGTVGQSSVEPHGPPT
jgi:hypothetical protein